MSLLTNCICEYAVFCDVRLLRWDGWLASKLVGRSVGRAVGRSIGLFVWIWFDCGCCRCGLLLPFAYFYVLWVSRECRYFAAVAAHSCFGCHSWEDGNANDDQYATSALTSAAAVIQTHRAHSIHIWAVQYVHHRKGLRHAVLAKMSKPASDIVLTKATATTAMDSHASVCRVGDFWFRHFYP